MQLLYILGRQPAIGLAELESLYGAEHVHAVSQHAVVECEVAIPFERIGSSIKQATIITTTKETNWKNIQNLLQKIASDQLKTLPSEGKVKLGLSAYGFTISAQRINATGLTLKKTIRAKGRSVRLVPNNEPALNSAQVFHNKLTRGLGWEFIILKDAQQTIVALTDAVQDIDEYTLRDRGRPKRDARVGMLPPKLAQTIINLAASTTPAIHGTQILDPFCGTGVILQEASLMGYDIYGTDLEKRMIDYSDQNLQWLAQRNPNLTAHSKDNRYYKLEVGDATKHHWSPVNIIACETYLGRPFTTPPTSEVLHKNRQDCDTIIRKFLENIHGQIPSGTRLCLAVPAWFVGSQVYHLKTLDYLDEIGYNSIDFVHARRSELIYHREDQIVGRELVVITRK